MILWKKSPVQSFVVFWPVLKKLWTCKVLNLTRVASDLVFQTWFSLHIFVNFMEKQIFAQFYGRFELIKLQSFAKFTNCV